MKKIITLMMFVVISLSSNAQTGSACFQSWYDTYGYFSQQWSNDGNVYTLANFLNSGQDLVITVSGEGTLDEYGGTQYPVSLSAPNTQSYEAGGYFYFCDNAGYFAALYPGQATDYLVMCAYADYCSLVKDDPTYGNYICLGAYWDTAYSAWDYIYIYLNEDDETAIKTISAEKSPVIKTIRNGRVVVRRGQEMFNLNGTRIK